VAVGGTDTALAVGTGTAAAVALGVVGTLAVVPGTGTALEAEIGIVWVVVVVGMALIGVIGKVVVAVEVVDAPGQVTGVVLRIQS
jgi:hypothetical protein